MIRRPRAVYRMMIDLIPRIELAHIDLTRIVQILRATGTMQVWTGEPTAGTNRFNASAWVQHFESERARLLALRDEVAPIMQRVYPETYADAVDYVQTVPTIIAAINSAIDRHRNADTTLRNEQLTNGERTQLATAIEAELEA